MKNCQMSGVCPGISANHRLASVSRSKSRPIVSVRGEQQAVGFGVLGHEFIERQVGECERLVGILIGDPNIRVVEVAVPGHFVDAGPGQLEQGFGSAGSSSAGMALTKDWWVVDRGFLIVVPSIGHA